LVSSINGLGKLIQSGSGILTLGSENTSTGGVDLNNATLILDHSSGLGTGVLRSNNGSLQVNPIMNQLIVDGPVTLLSNATANGNITFNGALSLASNHSVTESGITFKDQLLKSINGDVSLNGTVNAGATAKTDNRRLTIQAGGSVVIGDTIGTAVPVVYSDFETGQIERIPYVEYRRNPRTDS
jgi:hypothetical protein